MGRFNPSLEGSRVTASSMWVMLGIEHGQLTVWGYCQAGTNLAWAGGMSGTAHSRWLVAFRLCHPPCLYDRRAVSVSERGERERDRERVREREITHREQVITAVALGSTILCIHLPVARVLSVSWATLLVLLFLHPFTLILFPLFVTFFTCESNFSTS